MVELSEQLTYYRGALRALRFCEQRRPTGRRFGADADNRWKLFRGDLTTGDRIDLMVRDADSEWPRAFGARTMFALRGVAEDEAFGAEWSPLDGVDAEQVWRAVAGEDTPPDVAKTLGAVAAAWQLELAPMGPGAITPTSQFVVAGPSAIAALMVGFTAATDVDWSAQVVCVATPPAHRQLAAVGTAMLNTTKATTLLLPRDHKAGAKTPGWGAQLVHSPDVDADDLALATALAEEQSGA